MVDGHFFLSFAVVETRRAGTLCVCVCVCASLSLYPSSMKKRKQRQGTFSFSRRLRRENRTETSSDGGVFSSLIEYAAFCYVNSVVRSFVFRRVVCLHTSGWNREEKRAHKHTCWLVSLKCLSLSVFFPRRWVEPFFPVRAFIRSRWSNGQTSVRESKHNGRCTSVRWGEEGKSSPVVDFFLSLSLSFLTILT